MEACRSWAFRELVVDGVDINSDTPSSEGSADIKDVLHMVVCGCLQVL